MATVHQRQYVTDRRTNDLL